MRTKSPSLPFDPVVQQMQHPASHSGLPAASRLGFRNHLVQASIDEGRHVSGFNSNSLRNADSNGYIPSTGLPLVPPKKAVSWNDTAIQQQTSVQPVNPDPLVNGGNSSSGITLEDIDEVLGSSTEQDEPSTLLPNTPNVIGSQEVYRDPRERLIQEKMKNKVQTGSAAVQGPEKLSFKEKMNMFAIQSNAAATNGQKGPSSSSSSATTLKSSALSSGLREGENGNIKSIPEEPASTA